MTVVRDPDVTHAEVTRLLQYDASTGLLYWRVSRRGGIIAGQIAGVPHQGRYVRISFMRRRMAAHRLVWFYVYGTWPGKYIDHIDGNGLNNRIENLREATKQQNSQNRRQGNNLSGIRGVYSVQMPPPSKGIYNVKPKKRKPWCAKIMVDDKSIHLGNFYTKEEAFAARKEAEDRYFGEFSWKGGSQ